MDFDEWKKIVEAIEASTDVYEVKSFKPWKSTGNKQYITIQLVKKD
jgi:hypothetical protein